MVVPAAAAAAVAVARLNAVVLDTCTDTLVVRIEHSTFEREQPVVVVVGRHAEEQAAEQLSVQQESRGSDCCHYD